VVRDPYARWCGRGGTARCPPIPIISENPYRQAELIRVLSHIPVIPASLPRGK
jgi:hypothetical protein